VLANPVYRYRMLTLAEGWSFVLLLVFGSLLSRISDINLVMPLGMLHGVLFVLLVLGTLLIRRRLEWGFGTTLVALICSVIPLAPFFFHHAKKDEFLYAERTAQPA
jgi:integral membrane protein